MAFQEISSMLNATLLSRYVSLRSLSLFSQQVRMATCHHLMT